MSKQVILVTGASSGFGLMTARALAQAGHTVYASMRETEGRNAPRVAEAAAWSKAEGFDLRTVELDVQSDSSTEAGVAQILKDAGRLDVIVHNAGHMVFGPAEVFTPEQFIQQFDVNVLGAQRVNRAALPHMRGRGKGLLVWVGSSSRRGGTPPFLAPYFAAKAAMDALAVSYSTKSRAIPSLLQWLIEKLPQISPQSRLPGARKAFRGCHLRVIASIQWLPRRLGCTSGALAPNTIAAPPASGGRCMTTNPARSNASTSRSATMRAIISPASFTRVRPL
jgi:NADP-dependent 3-hydroxy acid dehydrogenase YdfG